MITDRQDNVMSGWQVLISTAFVQMLAALLTPWIDYTVLRWTAQYPGIAFPAEYGSQVGQVLILLFQVAVGIGHMLAIGIYRSGGVRVRVHLPTPPPQTPDGD